MLRTTTTITTAVANTARRRVRFSKPNLISIRPIGSDESSRPFPSPYPTRPAQIAKPETEGQEQQQQQQEETTQPNKLPVPMSTSEQSTHTDKSSTTTTDSKKDDSNQYSNLTDNNNDTIFENHSLVHDPNDIITSTPFQPQHHFDTYKLLLALERQGFSRTQAEVVMKGIKFKLRESSAFIRRRLLLKSDLDNETYLFKAGLSELRTEVQTMRRNDTQMLQADMAAVTREVEALGQRLREDVALMRNEVTLDLNNRKNEGREELKAIDMRIQEINNKITVSLGEVRTGIEAVRWETIWKGMTGVAVAAMGIAGLGYLLTRYAAHKAEAIRVQKQRQLKQLQEDARIAGAADMEVVY